MQGLLGTGRQLRNRARPARADEMEPGAERTAARRLIATEPSPDLLGGCRRETLGAEAPAPVGLLHVLTEPLCLREIGQNLCWQDLARVKVAVKGFECQGMEEDILWAEVDFLKGPLVVSNWTEFDRGYLRTRRLREHLEDILCATKQVLSDGACQYACVGCALQLCFLGMCVQLFRFTPVEKSLLLMVFVFVPVLLLFFFDAYWIFQQGRRWTRLRMHNLDSLFLPDGIASRGVEEKLTEDLYRLAELPRTLAVGGAFLGRWREILLDRGQPAVLRRALRSSDDRAVIEAVGVGPLDPVCWPYGPPSRLSGVLTRAVGDGRLGDARRLVRAGVPATSADDAGATAAMAVRQRLPEAIAKKDYRETYRLLSVAPVAWPDRTLCDALVDLVGGTYKTSFWVHARPLIRQAVDDSQGRTDSYELPDGVRRALADLEGSSASVQRLQNWIDAWSSGGYRHRFWGQSILLQLLREEKLDDARRLVRSRVIEPGSEALHLARTLSGDDDFRWF